MPSPPAQKVHVSPWQPAWEGLRVADVLKDAAPFLSSRDRVLVVSNGLVAAGEVTLKDFDAKFPEGQELRLDLRHGVRGVGKPKRPPLKQQIEVLHDDEHLVVVSKAAGVLSDPQESGLGGPPVIELLKHYWKSQGAKALNPILVHRLDKETSGLLVLAKNRIVGRELQRQAADKWMERRYRALVEGRPLEAEGAWRSYLGEGEDGLKQVVAPAPADAATAEEDDDDAPATPSGKLAITHYKVGRRGPSGVSELELRLETGRMHQIRIHCAEAGCPVAGDKVYYRLAGIRQPTRRLFHRDAPRMFLHAERLKFRHPATQKWLTFRSEVPAAFEEWLKVLAKEEAARLRARS